MTRLGAAIAGAVIAIQAMLASLGCGLSYTEQRIVAIPDGRGSKVKIEVAKGLVNDAERARLVGYLREQFPDAPPSDLEGVRLAWVVMHHLTGGHTGESVAIQIQVEHRERDEWATQLADASAAYIESRVKQRLGSIPQVSDDST